MIAKFVTFFSDPHQQYYIRMQRICFYSVIILSTAPKMVRNLIQFDVVCSTRLALIISILFTIE